MSLSEAEAAVRLAKTDPAAGLDRARRLSTLPDPAVRVRAMWAEGRALFELARNTEAVVVLGRASDAAHGAVKDRIDVSLALAWFAGGRADAATALLEDVMRRSGDEVVGALALSQLGVFDMVRGDLESAVDRFTASLPVLRRSAADADAVARVVANRGYCRLVAGDLPAAERDAVAAIALGREAGERVVVVGALQNLGYVELQRGNVPGALALLHDAEQEYAAIANPGRNLSTLFDDLAEAHQLAGLPTDAVRHARRAMAALGGGEALDRRAEAQFRLAACLLDAGEDAEALRTAREAAGTFEDAGRTLWAHRASLLALDTEPVDVAADGSLLERAETAAAELEDAGWATEARQVRNRVADALLRTGASERAAAVLPGSSSSDTALGRVEQALSDVLAAVASGHSPHRALQRAHALVVDHQLRLADPELRAGVARLCSRLRWWATQQALDDGSPERLLVTVESWRAMSFDLPRPASSGDVGMRELTQRLRQAVNAAGDERADPAKVAEVARLERELRARSLRVRPDDRAGQVPDPADVRERIIARLGQRTVMGWFVHDGTVHGLSTSNGVVRHWVCGPLAPLLAQVERIQFDVARLLRPGLPTASAAARFAALEQTCVALGRQLLDGPPPEGELILSPPPELLAVPWALVFGRPEQPITVTPSATAWATRSADTARSHLGVLVGPGLDHGQDDARAVGGEYGQMRVVGPDDATSTALHDLVGEVDVLHIAAHGTFRPDSPRFSALQLADGPYNLYELDRLTAPTLVSLAACTAGLSVARAGAELLGTAPAWFAAGATSVLAPTHPVPDEAASIVAGALLGALPGRTPQGALAQTNDVLSDEAPRIRMTAFSTLCFGADLGQVERP